MRAARSCVEEFTASSDLGDLFIRFLSTPESEQTLEAQRRFIYEWVGLADKHASWLGKLLRIVLVAPCRSTKCESDFSLVQHILAPRRLRMSRTTLAAYLFCKRARSFVTQAKDETGVTKAGTRDILTLFKTARAAPPSLSAATSSTSSSPSTSSCPTNAVACGEADDDEEEDRDVRYGT
jgi:hypothetical protein